MKLVRSIPMLLVLGIVLLSGCRLIESEPEWDNPADEQGQAYAPRSSSSSVNASSSSLENPGSSSSVPGAVDGSSSSSPNAGGCVIQAGIEINQACTYAADQQIADSVTLGPAAQLRFLNGARLAIIGGNLKIAGGARLIFGAGSFVHVSQGGSLVAVGTEKSPVLFSADNALEPWGAPGNSISSAGLYLDGTAALSSLEYVSVSGAVVGLYAADSNLVEIINSVFSDNSKYGISLWEPQASGAIRYTNFSGNGTADIWANLTAAEKLGVGLTMQAGISLPTTSVVADLALPGYTYQVGGEIYVSGGARLSIAAGADLKFAPGAFVNVDKGRLVATGTSALPVVFEPLAADGFWGDDWETADGRTGIHFNQGCLTGSLLEHVRIYRAHTALSSWCSSPVEVRDSEILDYQYYAFVGASTLYKLTGQNTIQSAIIGADLRFE